MPDRPTRAVDRLAAAFLLVVLTGGCLFLWIGIPAGGLWLLGKLVESSTNHFVIGLIGVPAAMALFAPFLFWVNSLYLRVTLSAEPEYDEDEDEWPRRRPGGPLEPLLIGSLAIAIVAFLVWFFVFADNPLLY